MHVQFCKYISKVNTKHVHSAIFGIQDSMTVLSCSFGIITLHYSTTRYYHVSTRCLHLSLVRFLFLLNKICYNIKGYGKMLGISAIVMEFG